MKNIEREIKVLSHINELETALDNLGVEFRIEEQKVLSTKIGKESHKLKIKNVYDGDMTYIMCRKHSVSRSNKAINKNFSNKQEVETILTKEEFNVAEKMFRTMFKSSKIMDYSIKKKRYIEHMGYMIDICKVIAYEGKDEYYSERFIEIEEVNGYKNRITLEKLLEQIIPNEHDIVTMTCGLSTLNSYYRKIGKMRRLN